MELPADGRYNEALDVLTQLSSKTASMDDPGDRKLEAHIDEVLVSTRSSSK